MKKLFITFLIAVAAMSAITTQAALSPAQDKKGEKSDSVYLFASIKDATFKHNLSEGFVIPYDNDGNPLDTIKCQLSHRWNGTEIVDYAVAGLNIDRSTNVIMFDIGSPGYQTETVTWSLDGIGKRELYREMPVIFLSKARKLKDLTVVASKVKFYNKGDTVVYDADAFQLAEGSMLDALVSQLPGAQIDENGRISVNGEFVESLLLNGKDFFKDDHTVILENIPAYTVKSVEVYKGHTTEEKLNFDNSAPKHLTMDVKLKKEYNHGWLLNLQAGYGTADRYLGRMFASWFTPTTSVIVTGMTNNLNDNRTPGKTDSWTPQSMPSGRQSVRSINIGYNHQSADEKVIARGNVDFSGKSTDYATSTSSTQFLSNTNTYGRTFMDSKSSNFAFNTNHLGAYTTNKNNRLMLQIAGNYSKTDNYSNSLSGTFNSDYSDISRQALEAIYSDGSVEELKAVVNRSLTLSEGVLKSGGFNVQPSVSLKLPGTSDRLSMHANLAYVGSKRETWNDYNINFGSNPVPAERRRQFSDNSPNYRKMFDAGITYSTSRRGQYLAIAYDYSFEDKAKDSHMYALERLEDMGIFGVLPENYESTLDPSNSYSSTTQTNGHFLSISYYKYKEYNKGLLRLQLGPQVGIEHHRLNYWRDNRSYLVKRTSVILPRVFATADLSYSFGKSKDEEAGDFNNQLRYWLDLETEGPELLHLVDVVNTADPLNIEEGNPNLKNSFKQTHNLSWNYTPFGKPINNRIRISYTSTSNALVRGYVYNTETGVRRFRTYNVNGNHSYSAANTFNWEFGSQKQFSLSSRTEWSLSNEADMLGINAETPTKAQVRNTFVSEDLRLGYKIGKQLFQVFGNASNRHTTSEREDFNTINAQHYKYGVNATFTLPAGFGIGTDLTFYKRVGYGVKELDTTDAVWNMRLTYAPKGNKHWVFTADGFDLLHKLSNINYAVTATGRTVTYTNSLPRYFVITAQYRLNIQPKKK